MGLNILIFTDSIFPREHLNGLCLIASESEEVRKIHLIGHRSDELFTEWHNCLGDKLSCVSRGSYWNVAKAILCSDLVFGFPKGFLWIRMLSAIGVCNVKPIFFGPGYVTKAVGFFKHPEKGSWPIIQQHIKFYLLNSFYICTNQSDRVYLSAALGYPLSRTNCSPLPKHIYINRMLVGENNVSAQNCILFAPTHRWDKVIPPLTIYLNDNSFVDHVMSLGFGIYHSKHPETVDAQLDERVQIFKNNWTGISCVVTDYSSIGEDYLFSGGKTVIAHMEDRKEFEKNQGVGPLFMSNKTDKTITYTLEELKEVLDNLDQETCTPVPNLLNINNYFQHVIKKNEF